MLGWIEEKLKSIPKTDVSAFVCSLIFGFFAHYFVITNKLTNHDDIRQTCDEMVDIKWGRWLLSYASDITGNMSLPFNCLLGLVFLALAAVCVSRALGLLSQVTAGLLGAFIAVFPSVAFSFIFNSTADAYALSLLLSAAGALAAVRIKNRLAATVLSVLLITASLGMYQAFLGIAVGIMILAGISSLLFEGASFREVLFDEIRYAVTAGVSVVLYLCVSKAVQAVTGIEASSYQGMDRMGVIDWQAFPTQLRHAYTKSLGYYIINSRGVHYRWLTVLLAAVLALSALVFVVRLIRLRPGWPKAALAAVLMALFPMAGGLIYIMGAENMHLLVINGFAVIAFWPLMFADRAEALLREGAGVGGIKTGVKIYQGAVLFVLALTVYNYITLDNKAYMIDYYVYEESYSYAQTVASVIRRTPGYSADTVIYMIGKPASPAIAIDEFFEDDPRAVDFTNAGLDRDFNDIYTMPSFYWYYLGLTNSIREIDMKEARELGAGELAVFPDDGSLYADEGCIVIRFE